MPDERMSITCVIPTFNRPEMLARSLQSVYSQTLKPIQVIVCENGNDTAVRDLVGTFQDPDITSIHLSTPIKLPALQNWLRGVEKADGEYVKIVWDDDWLEPNCLEVMSILAWKHAADIVMTAAWMVLPHGKYLAYDKCELVTANFEEVLPLICQRILPNSPLAALIRKRDLLDAFNFNKFPIGCITDNLVVGPDLAANFWGLMRGGVFVFSPQPLVSMYSDGNNMTQQNLEILPRMYRKTILALIRHHYGRSKFSDHLFVSLWRNSRFFPSTAILKLAYYFSR